MSHDYVARIVPKLSGAAGLSGVDVYQPKGWILKDSVHSNVLRKEMVKWVEWLSNGLPPYAAYRAPNAARGLVAEKRPGVRPIACGEIWMRLMQSCNQAQPKTSAKVSCGAKQLCAGLECGIEGSLHAVREVWPEADG